MNRVFASVLFLFLLMMGLNSCQDDQTGFAIVADPESYNNAKAEIEAYSDVLETEGLKTYLLVKDYRSPDSLRNDLLALYKADVPIEGAVFIGDIPIPMVTNAQHMTSAFKMDQQHFSLERASVPSDRFYDDFDLIFDFIRQDSVAVQRYYYSLNAQSPQTINPDIYSGRIKLPEVENKYGLLRAYMQKVVKAHQTENKLDQFFMFSGNGYNSESTVIRLDEQQVLSQQLAGNPVINFLDHKRTTFVKFPYMAELQRDELDVALLHHHGAPGKEYLSGWPASSSYMFQVGLIKRYLRGRVEDLKGDDDPARRKLLRYFKDKFDIPASWFPQTIDSETFVADSTWSADLDLTLKDFEVYNYQPNVRFAIFDACYNGSFHQNQYLAGAYLFSGGKTIAAQANSVNSIQDKWPQEMIGLLSLGMRVGEWNKMVCYLETHIIGDPTYRFTSMDPSINVQKMVVSDATDDDLWLGLLDSDYPDVQVLALRKLANNGYEKISSLLLETYKTSDLGCVRAECLKLSALEGDENFIELLAMALDDDYELVQRFAVKMAGDCGDEALIPAMVKLGFTNMSERVEFQYRNSIGFFDAEKLIAEFNKQAPNVDFIIRPEETLAQRKKVFERANRRFQGTYKTILDPESPEKSTYLEIRSLRNSNYHMGVDGFLTFIEKNENQEFRQMMIEALGWFRLSSGKQKIIDFCTALSTDETEPEAIRKEAGKTVLRLS